MLSKYIASDQRDWDSHLPMLMLAYRSSIHESTGQTPAAIMFGREVALPTDLLLGSFPDQKHRSSDLPYLHEVKEKLKEIHEIARENLEKSFDRQKRLYDHHANAHSYNVGDSVFLFDPTKKKGISPKLQSRWVGPYLVVGKLSDLLYKIQLRPQSKIKIVHHDRLKLEHGGSQGGVETTDGNVSNGTDGVVESIESDVEVPSLSPKSKVLETHCSLKAKSTGCVTTHSGRQVKLPKKFENSIL